MKNLWCVKQDKYNSDENSKYETIFTLANGYKGIRGSLEFSNICEKGHFIAGVFDKANAQVTELVNCQDSLGFNIYIDGDKLDIDKCEILDFHRYLDLKKGLLIAKIHLKNQKGKISKIESKRFVSRNNVHRWGIEYKISPVNYRGKILIESVIDGTITNHTIDIEKKTNHLYVDKSYDLGSGIALKTSINDNDIKIIEGTVLKASSKTENLLKNRKHEELEGKVKEAYEIEVKEEEEYIIEKYCVTYTSRDSESDLYKLFENDMKVYVQEGLDNEINLHTAKWEEIWRDIDIKIEGDDLAQIGIRFNVFHLHSSAYEGDNRVSIGAKALHGEGYRGHVFWDTEIFMLPFFIYTSPQNAKTLLMYRYNTLDGARKNAESGGYKGVLYPWESADNGLEVTPNWGLDFDGSKIRIWTGEEEFHINSDIVFGIFEYFKATHDKEFMIDYGVEMIMEVARFWESRVEYNKLFDRFEICRVIGPDEFHEHVNNNAFTNYMAKWTMKKSLEIVQWMMNEDKKAYERLIKKLNIIEKNYTNWKRIEEKLYVPFVKEKRLFEQFDGYFNLKNIEIDEHDENGMPIWPDLQGTKLEDTQFVKQPDVLMLLILLHEEFDEGTIKNNYYFYEPRTMHKSSLSPSMHSILGLRIGDNKNAYNYFMKTILTDLHDNQGNAELGLHAAAAGGSWQSVVIGFGGMHVDSDGIICFKPWIPENWKSLSFKLFWHGIPMGINISQENVTIESCGSTKIKVYDIVYSFEKNRRITVKRI